jgi:hypothetical protein
VREKTELPAQRLEEGLPLGVVGGTELQLHGNMGGDVDGGCTGGGPRQEAGSSPSEEESSLVTEDINRWDLLDYAAGHGGWAQGSGNRQGGGDSSWLCGGGAQPGRWQCAGQRKRGGARSQRRGGAR